MYVRMQAEPTTAWDINNISGNVLYLFSIMPQQILFYLEQKILDYTKSGTVTHFHDNYNIVLALQMEKRCFSPNPCYIGNVLYEVSYSELLFSIKWSLQLTAVHTSGQQDLSIKHNYRSFVASGKHILFFIQRLWLFGSIKQQIKL